jgi:hypothetical protein
VSLALQARRARSHQPRFTLSVAILGLLLASSVAPVSAATGSITIGHGGGADGEIGGTFSSIGGAPWEFDGVCYGDVGTAFFEYFDAFIEARTAFEFPVTGLPEGAAITSASLSLFHNTGSASETLAIYGYVGDGTISADDMVVTGTPVIFTSEVYVYEDHDVTAMLTPEVISAGWAGFSLRAEPPIFEGTGSAHGFNCPTMLFYPILTINYVVGDPDEDADGVVDTEDACPGSVPDAFPELKQNRYSYDGTGLVSGLASNPPYTIEQTGGCSATQIIGAMGLGHAHKRFGLSRSALEAWIAALP